MDTVHAVGDFLTSRDFAVNFVANLGGALIGALVGVSLAFWFERVKGRRDATGLYGRILRTSRSELAYLKPLCESGRDHFRAGQNILFVDSVSVPATKALLTSPVVHDQAPYSLIMTLSILSAKVDATDGALREAQQGKLERHKEAREILSRALGDDMDRVCRLITLTLERIDSELKRLGLEKTPDAGTQEVSRRLREALQNLPPNRDVPKPE